MQVIMEIFTGAVMIVNQAWFLAVSFCHIICSWQATLCLHNMRYRAERLAIWVTPL
jgi:hypothetical protein